MVLIRPATNADRAPIWSIFRNVLVAGETYALPADMAREDALGFWFGPGHHVYVALEEGVVVGTYLLRANQRGPGAHVANAAFLVASAARGRGVGCALAGHCLAEARRAEYSAMQFNFVVSTNLSAVQLWRRLGFAIVGTLPGAFRHPRHGFVDAYVMFRSLADV